MLLGPHRREPVPLPVRIEDFQSLQDLETVTIGLGQSLPQLRDPVLGATAASVASTRGPQGPPPGRI